MERPAFERCPPLSRHVPRALFDLAQHEIDQTTYTQTIVEQLATSASYRALGPS
jgi:hypothetical protein